MRLPHPARGRRCGLLLVALLLASPAAIAQVDGRAFGPKVKPSLDVPRASGPIRIDGQLDDEAWQGASVADGFTEIIPGDQVEPRVRTEVLVTYDARSLYVAFRAYDDPGQVRATLRNRDEIFSDDWVGLILDPYGDAAQAYEIFANPLGIQGDLFMHGASGNEDEGFDLIYHTDGRLTEDGYVVEMAIPFSSLRFPAAAAQRWQVTFIRNHPRETRRLYSWATVTMNDPCLLCQLGAIGGIRDVEPGTKLQLLPAVVGYQSGALVDAEAPAAGFDNRRLRAEASLNLRYDLTSSVAAEATINPDFSQVESDAAQIDVNETFALFYPERRPFFQEGNELFQTWVDVVYTRSINNPIGATKLTGRAGRTSLAYLSAVDEDTPVLLPFGEESNLVRAGRSFSNILRARRSFGTNSHVGGTLTDRRLFDGGSGSTISADLKHQFLKSYAVEAQLAVSRTEEPEDAALSEQISVGRFAGGRHTAAFDGETFPGYAAFLSVERSSRRWNSDLSYSRYSPTFRAANGFVTGNDFQSLRLFQALNFYPKSRWVTSLSPSFSAERRLTFAGVRRRDEFGPSLEAQLIGQTYLGAELEFERERFRGIDFDGLYDWNLVVSSRFSDPVTGGFYLSGGREIARFLDAPEVGRQRELGFFVTLKPVQRLVVQSSLDHAALYDRETKETLFRGFILRTQAGLQFTRELSLRLVAQYDDFDDRLSLEPLVAYRINPFSVFYLGSTHAYDRFDAPYDLTVSRRQLFFKFQYLIQR